MKESIHDYDAKLRTVLKKMNKSRTMSKKNKALFLKFRDECLAEGLSKGRTLKYLYDFIRLSDWFGKDFETATKEDLKPLVIKVEASPFVPFTKVELLTCIKKLFKMIKNSEEYPPIVKWIKPNRRTIDKVKLPEELLTEDDVISLINAAKNPRDKAFVALLYETGCRIGEILFIKIRQIQFDDNGAVVVVSGKTGSRRLRLVTSVPYLTQWLNNHAQKNEPSAYLWSSNGGGVISYQRARSILTELGIRAGVNKKLNPHNFRHSRATHLANHLTEAQMKEYFGWVRASDMAAVYVHLSGRDVDHAILKLHGISNYNKDEEYKLVPKNCPRCKKKNEATNRFCSICGLPLDRETIDQLTKDDIERSKSDRLMQSLWKDDEVRRMLLRKVRELDV